MDRQLHKKYIPQCPRQAGLPDQYMWKDKDTTYYQCHNGISHPIYDCKGWVNYSLPLEEYPPVNEVHPQIEMTRRMHMNYRQYPFFRIPRENFSHRGNPQILPKQGFHLASDMVPGYPLPNPYGNNRGCSACNS